MTQKSLALSKKAHCSPLIIQAVEKLRVSEAFLIPSSLNDETSKAENHLEDLPECERELFNSEVNCALSLINDLLQSNDSSDNLQ